MTHTVKGGAHKILDSCSLPLTGKGCVDMIITEMGVFNMGEDGLTLVEIDQVTGVLLSYIMIL